MTYLYAMRAVGTPLVKVGYSADPARRVREIQSLAPQPLEIIGTIRDCDHRTEAAVHRRLRHWRRRGEWFDLDAATAQFVKDLGWDIPPWCVVRLCAGHPVNFPNGLKYTLVAR